MPTFEEFVQTELPKRPFSSNDGLPGQVPVRSTNANRPRELVWVDASELGSVGGGQSSVITLESGVTAPAGTPVKVVGNVFEFVYHTTDPRVVAVLKEDAVAGLPAQAVIMGSLVLSGLSPGSPYFLGNGVITTTVPASGYLIRLGQAITSTLFVVNIEESIYLS